MIGKNGLAEEKRTGASFNYFDPPGNFSSKGFPLHFEDIIDIDLFEFELFHLFIECNSSWNGIDLAAFRFISCRNHCRSNLVHFSYHLQWISRKITIYGLTLVGTILMLVIKWRFFEKSQNSIENWFYYLLKANEILLLELPWHVVTPCWFGWRPGMYSHSMKTRWRHWLISTHA